MLRAGRKCHPLKGRETRDLGSYALRDRVLEGTDGVWVGDGLLTGTGVSGPPFLGSPHDPTHSRNLASGQGQSQLAPAPPPRAVPPAQAASGPEEDGWAGLGGARGGDHLGLDTHCSAPAPLLPPPKLLLLRRLMTRSEGMAWPEKRGDRRAGPKQGPC